MCHDKLDGGKLHGNISRNGYGNAIIGRYGGCFEEDIMRLMCDRAHCILIVYLCVKVGGARWLTPTNLPLGACA